MGELSDDEEREFQATSIALWGERVRIGAATFMLFAVVASGFEMTFFPDRLRAVVLAFLMYTVVCVVALVATRRRPLWTRVVTMATSIALIPCITSYHVMVGNMRELLLMPLGLYLCATTALLPWGAIGQGLACAVAAAMVIASPWWGMEGLLPLPYTVAGMVAVAFVTIPCADWFHGLRRAAWADAMRARHAEAALERMAESAREMHMLAVSGPAGGQ